jgi:hypothetical protein
MDHASAPLSLVGAKPEDRRSMADRPEREHGGKARRARPVVWFRGEQLMYPAARQAAPERSVKGLMSSADPPGRGQQPAPGNRGQIPPEHGKMINRLAHHLFLICSQVRFGLPRVKPMEIG